MRIVIACGGTGGHFYPGYALGRCLRERGHEVLYCLRTGDPAGPRLAAEDLPYFELPLRGFPREPSLAWLGFGLALARSMRIARNTLRVWRPSAAVGMGGYLSFPLAAAAGGLGIPLILHEANAVLGLANKAGLPFAEVLATGFPMEEGARRARIVFTGTPVRRELWERSRRSEARAALGLDPDALVVLVFGGSQGARSLNGDLPPILAEACARGPRFQVLHLAGPAGSAEVEALYASLGAPKAVVRGYLDDMKLAYAASDLAVCRSGAATLAELAAQALPALLIPYPAASNDHQAANALRLERAGAARMLREPLGGPRVLQALEALLRPASLLEMSRAYGKAGFPPPAECVGRLADLVEEAAG
ncbi:MAG: UDP-N-acetylglucosamine--N-acetylmuramyl-(pentapeptide) pyrophosphoryl-undecaprenol N-acetylglucosamine transferase [Elusimicrobiota bacterium]